MPSKWKTPLSPLLANFAALVTVSGLALFAFLSYFYERFYRSFGISPASVGIGYAETMSRSWGFIALAVLYCLAFALVLALFASVRKVLRLISLESLAAQLSRFSKGKEKGASEQGQQQKKNESRTEAQAQGRKRGQRRRRTQIQERKREQKRGQEQRQEEAQKEEKGQWLKLLNSVAEAYSRMLVATLLFYGITFLVGILFIAPILMTETVDNRVWNVKHGGGAGPVTLGPFTLLDVSAHPVKRIYVTKDSGIPEDISRRHLVYLGTTTTGVAIVYDTECACTTMLPSVKVALGMN
ncbi:hypothetical protein ABZX90_41410 [Streptomyces sp. NPDC002935]|uniref:hypothetical protein n=1 Tax=Streptomyces sp. NPDC002935 TaxID=3154545 RepID=UPI0033B5ABF4